MIVRARAPLRVEFVGGTDIEPWASERGAYVLNAAIDRYVTVSVYSRETAMVISCPELGVYDNALVSTGPVAESEVEAALLERTGVPPARQDVTRALEAERSLMPIKACLNLVGLTGRESLYIHITSDTPLGTGLGASSAMLVATIRALMEAKRLLDGTSDPPNGLLEEPYAIARYAWEIERQVLGWPGGYQDHIAAAYGGFNAVVSKSDFPAAEEIHHFIPTDDVLAELETCFLLCYLGRRGASDYISLLSTGMLAKKGLEKCMESAEHLHKDLIAGDLRSVGVDLESAWDAKRASSPGLANDRILGIYKVARVAGAIGGTLCGAGGGGFLLLYCEPHLRPQVARSLERERSVDGKHGCYTWPFVFEARGLHAWQVPE